MTGMIGRAILPLALLIAGGIAQTPQAPDVVIRSSAREVLLDVVVRDAHGKLVTNLKPEDVAIYEDGVLQNVRAFRLVAGSEVRVEDEKQAVEAKATAAGAPAQPGRPPVNPLRTVNIVCLILNDLNADTRAFAFESATKFVDKELRPNTFIGIFTLDASGLRPIFPFSNNRDGLLRAVKLASVNQLPAMNAGSAAMLNGLSTYLSEFEMGVSGSGVDPLGTRHDMTASAADGLHEIDALKGLIAQLRLLPFQKTVLLLSTGLTRPPDQLEYWDSMIRAAVSAGVTFYTADVYGLGVCQDDPNTDRPGDCLSPTTTTARAQGMLKYAAGLGSQQGSTSWEGYKGAPPWPGGKPTTPDQIAAQAAWYQQHPGTSIDSTLAMRTMENAHEDDYTRFAVSSANPQETLRELAERTGGFLIANTNNVDQLLSHVMEEVDTHYEIAYPPKSERDDGHFRKIEVKLTRPGLRVDTRNGYFAIPDNGQPLTPEEMTGLRALDTQPRPHAFDFLSRAYRFRDSGGRAQYSIAFEMPISNLTATAQHGRHRYHATLLALVKNQDGVIVDRISKDVPSDVPDDQFDKVRVEFMTYQHAVSLPPARYTVETAVVDQEGNRASTGTFIIDNREQAGVGVSDLAVVRKLEDLAVPADPDDPFQYPGKRVLPFVASNFPPGMQPFVFFRVYSETGNKARPSARVRLLKDGKTLATLRPEVTEPDATGAIQMLLRLTGQPGNYEVRATVTQGKSSAERTLRFTLAK